MGIFIGEDYSLDKSSRISSHGTWPITSPILNMANMLPYLRWIYKTVIKTPVLGLNISIYKTENINDLKLLFFSIIRSKATSKKASLWINLMLTKVCHGASIPSCRTDEITFNLTFPVVFHLLPYHKTVKLKLQNTVMLGASKECQLIYTTIGPVHYLKW